MIEFENLVKLKVEVQSFYYSYRNNDNFGRVLIFLILIYEYFSAFSRIELMRKVLNVSSSYV